MQCRPQAVGKLMTKLSSRFSGPSGFQGSWAINTFVAQGAGLGWKLKERKEEPLKVPILPMRQSEGIRSGVQKGRASQEDQWRAFGILRMEVVYATPRRAN